MLHMTRRSNYDAQSRPAKARRVGRVQTAALGEAREAAVTVKSMLFMVFLLNKSLTVTS